MKINATLLGGECPHTFTLNGRIGQTIWELHNAGQDGITALEIPALRLAAYVHSLRGLGFTIDTELEEHQGPYPGHHARYRLSSSVLLQSLGQDGAE